MDILGLFILYCVAEITALQSQGYIGCYDNRRLLVKREFNSPINTGKLCVYKCSVNRYRYAGTKKSLCACGNALKDVFTSKRLCSVKCPGNKNEKCGGPHRQMSFYDVSGSTTQGLTSIWPTATSNTSFPEITSATEAVIELKYEPSAEKGFPKMIVYITAPVTLAVFVILSIICVTLAMHRRAQRKRGQKGQRKNEAQFPIEAVDKHQTDDNESVHIYDQCGNIYHSNTYYLTPLSKITTAFDDKNALPSNSCMNKNTNDINDKMAHEYVAIYEKTENSTNHYESVLPKSEHSENCYEALKHTTNTYHNL